MKIKDIVVMTSTMRFLQLMGIFPKKEDEPAKSVFIKCLGLLVIGYCAVCAMLHLLINLKNSEEYYLAEDVMPLLAYCGVLYFTFQYVRNIKSLVTMCKMLSDFESFGKPTNFDKFNGLFNRISKPYFYCHFVVVSSIMLGPVFTANKCEKENIERGINEVCGMVIIMWAPFDYDFFHVKQIIVIYQYCAAVSFAQTGGIISFSMFESVRHISFRFKHLCDTFVDVLSIRDPIERKQQFGRAVRYHYAVIEMGSIMDNCFGPCVISHMILTAPVLGSGGYRLATSAAVDAITLFFGWIIATILACSSSQDLQDSSEILRDIIYQTEWYNLDKELQRDLTLVIMKSQRPICITAGTFGNMTYALLLGILKTSYSYFTILQQELSN